MWSETLTTCFTASSDVDTSVDRKELILIRKEISCSTHTSIQLSSVPIAGQPFGSPDTWKNSERVQG